ncbi:MAG: TrkH family potassium uptake protein [Candidatus Eisenbacteria bacterium]|nr:TrkH family potassium uptake protein [Candidatus Eisenbacteria bacterium]
MNIRSTCKMLGGLLLFLGVMLLTPIPFALFHRDGDWDSFVLSSALALAAGGFLFLFFRREEEISYREGFGIVTFGWIAFALFGALPFVFSGAIPNMIDAFFESMPGFTTTGASVVTDFDGLSESIFFWRAMTHWLGGMGIIVLSIAILPFLGVGGMQLFEAEVPGPTADRLSPRIQTTAKLLWGVYFLLTFAETILLMTGGMDFHDAVCHAFATMATGGFSTRSASVGAYDSHYINGVITFFMVMAGANFSLHYMALRGRFRSYFRSQEFLFYGGVLLVAFVAMAFLNRRIYPDAGTNASHAAFQVTSIMTTTGFATADFERWPVLGQYILITLMFLGGCAGSTGGGMKNVRVLLLVKHAYVQLFRLNHPRGVRILKLDGKAVPDAVMQSILGFFALYIGIFVVSSLLMAALGLDLITAGASVVACLSNIGPGLGEVGPTDHYAHVPAAGKLLLTLCMLLGRLELFTVLVLLFPSFWKKWEGGRQRQA